MYKQLLLPLQYALCSSLCSFSFACLVMVELVRKMRAVSQFSSDRPLRLSTFDRGIPPRLRKLSTTLILYTVSSIDTDVSAGCFLISDSQQYCAPSFFLSSLHLQLLCLFPEYLAVPSINEISPWQAEQNSFPCLSSRHSLGNTLRQSAV